MRRGAETEGPGTDGSRRGSSALKTLIVSRITAFSGRRASTCRRGSSTPSPAAGADPAGIGVFLPSIRPGIPSLWRRRIHWYTPAWRAARIARHTGEGLAAECASGRVRPALRRMRTSACARVARFPADPFRRRALGRVAELGDDLPDGHALREIQVNGPAPILHRKHADSNPDAKTSNFSAAPSTNHVHLALDKHLRSTCDAVH